DRLERDRALVLTRGDVEVGRRDDVDVVLDDRLAVELGQRRLERLGAGVLAAELTLEELAGRLPGPEAGDAHLLGDLPPGGIDRRLELGLVDLDGDLDLVALRGLDRGSHETNDRSASPRSSRHHGPTPSGAGGGRGSLGPTGRGAAW